MERSESDETGLHKQQLIFFWRRGLKIQRAKPGLFVSKRGGVLPCCCQKCVVGQEAANSRILARKRNGVTVTFSFIFTFSLTFPSLMNILYILFLSLPLQFISLSILSLSLTCHYHRLPSHPKAASQSQALSVSPLSASCSSGHTFSPLRV